MSSIPVQLPLFPVDGKVCRRCDTLLPLERFAIHTKATGKLRNTCKACDYANTVAWNAANRERARMHRDSWRKANPEKRHASDMAYAQSHKAEAKARSAAWYAANTERALARNAAWHAANLTRHRALITRWHREHPERRRAIGKAWGKRHRGKVHAKARIRKQRIALNGGHYTGAEWEALKAQHGYRCLMCGMQEPEIRLTFDHIVPITKGGTDDIGNGQPLCRICNAKKGTRTIDLR